MGDNKSKLYTVSHNLFLGLDTVFPHTFTYAFIDDNEDIIGIDVNDGDIECLRLAICYDKNNILRIYIDELNKCSLSGSKILENLELLCDSFAKEIEYIEFSDASNVNLFNNESYSIELSTLRILSRGESWYNSLGYYSNDNISDRQSWNILREKTGIIDLLHTLKSISYFDGRSTATFGKNRIFISCINHIVEVLDDKDHIDDEDEFKSTIALAEMFITSHWNNINDYKIKEIYSIIENTRETNSEREFLYYILVGLITPLITYDHMLFKYL
jgi:hypothetical protein